MGLLAVLSARVPWVGTVKCAIQKQTSALAIRVKMEPLAPMATTPTLANVMLATRETIVPTRWIRAAQVLALTTGLAALEKMALQNVNAQADILATLVRLRRMSASRSLA